MNLRSRLDAIEANLLPPVYPPITPVELVQGMISGKIKFLDPTNYPMTNAAGVVMAHIVMLKHQRELEGYERS